MIAWFIRLTFVHSVADALRETFKMQDGDFIELPDDDMVEGAGFVIAGLD